MIDIIVASHNEHKVKEIEAILNFPSIHLLSLEDLDDHDEVVESGKTFLDNALLKAKFYAEKYQKPVISDDSGLVIPALNGKPGVFSARYSGGNDHQNNLKVLKEMEKIENRDAYFVSVIVLCYPNGEHYSFEGKAYGLIAKAEKGTHGFGYDSIFFDPKYQLNYAELNSTLKNQISHRANALKKFKEAINEIIDYK